jgi:hypothetical protein
MLDDLFENASRKTQTLAAKDTLSGSASGSVSRPNQTHFQNGNANLAATLKAKIAHRKEAGEISSSAKQIDMFPPARDSGEELGAGLADLVN